MVQPSRLFFQVSTFFELSNSGYIRGCADREIYRNTVDACSVFLNRVDGCIEKKLYNVY
jgi:hypothetical protein